MTRRSVGVALGRAGGFVTSRPDWFIDRISAANITNLRALVTLGLAVWTAVHYLTQAKWGTWEPSVEWLGFLVALGGLDVMQFSAKRLTWKNAQTQAPEAENGPVPPGS